jgi:hypothetical protein
MKCIAWNKKLHALTTAQIGTDDDALSYPIGAQHQDFNWIPEVIMIKLIVADAVQSHGCVGRPSAKGGGNPPAAIHFSLMKVTRTNPHVA